MNDIASQAINNMVCEICGEPVDSEGRTTLAPGRNQDESCSECGTDLFPQERPCLINNRPSWEF